MTELDGLEDTMGIRAKKPVSGGQPKSADWYAQNMDHGIVQEFIDKMESLKECARVYNARRGRLNKKIAEANGLIKVADLSPCEKSIFSQMWKRGQAAPSPWGDVCLDCKCAQCCSEGPTHSQLYWKSNNELGIWRK